MKAIFEPSILSGKISAPPSKSMAHRLLIGAALSKGVSAVSGIAFSEDILATIDCLKSLGAKVNIHGNTVKIDPENFLKAENPVLDCRESGSTLRFFIPLCLTLGKKVIFKGSSRLLERPLSVYENIAKENGFLFKKNKNTLTVCGNLKAQNIKVKGDISSQFITGLIFAFVYLKKDTKIEILPPWMSRSYIDLTLSALKSFGAVVEFTDEFNIFVKNSDLVAQNLTVEGDFSNAAFLDGFNLLGSSVEVENLNEKSLQGDRVYKDYFEKIENGTPTLDITDCPDLAPVLIAVSALKNGATLIGTNRLKIKESDRGAAMDKELKKLHGGLIFGENKITVPKQELKYNGEVLSSHNDHRIVMALSLILSKIGGEIEGIEAVNKSYPSFFEDIKSLLARVTLDFFKS